MLLGQLCYHTGQGEQCHEVGNGHETVEGVCDIPDHIQRSGGAHHNHNGEDELIDLGGLHAEQILDASGAVERPAENGGVGKEDQRDGNEQGSELLTKHSCEGTGDQLGTGLDPEGDVHAADNDRQSGQCADNNGIHKHFKDTECSYNETF